MSNNTNKSLSALSSLKSLTDAIPKTHHTKLIAGNDFILPKSWEFSNRVNQNYHLAFIKSGQGHYLYNNLLDPFEPGKIFLIGKGCKHSRILDHSKLPRIALLRFDILDNITNKSIENIMDGQAFSFTSKHPTLFYELFEKLYTYHAAHTPISDQLCQILLSQIIYELYNELNSTFSTSPDHRINRVVDYININYARKIPLAKLVSLSGLSRNYFLKLFSEYYQTSPRQYQIQLKIKHALQYLSETNLPISEIAEKLGYADQFCFTKQFKNSVGASPSQIRKSYIENDL